MPIDTTVQGDVASVRQAAGWLRDTLDRKVQNAAATLDTVLRRSGLAWDGDGGDAFRLKTGGGAQKTDQLSEGIRRAATTVEEHAHELARAKESMAGIRKGAAAAGLAVVGEVIIEPGSAPTVPVVSPGASLTPAEVDTYNGAVAAAKEHARLEQAYAKAQTDHDQVRLMYKLWCDTLKNVWDDITSKWFLVVGDMCNGAAQTLAAQHASILARQSKWLSDEAATLMEQARTAPAGTPARAIYSDADEAMRLRAESERVGASGSQTSAKFSKIAGRVGGGLAVAGVAYDISNGKPVVQAVTSGAVGFGASVAAGAVIGSFIPVPVLGTAAGALGGAVVGVFTSGMVDSVFQNHGAVGQAFDDGLTAVGDTGEAIGDLAEDAWDAIF